MINSKKKGCINIKPIILKIVLLGNSNTGKKTFINSFKQAFNENTTNYKEDILYQINKNYYKFIFDHSDNVDRALNTIKNANVVFLCFNTNDHSTFESLYPWTIFLINNYIESYYLLGNNYKEPYYSVDDILDECVYFNETSKLKFSSIDIIDFNKIEEIKRLIEGKLSSISIKNNKDDMKKDMSSCIIL